MTTSKIVIDADNGKLDAAADRSAKKVRGIADAAKDINAHFDRLGSSLVQRVAGLTAILGTIREINNEMKSRADQTVSASEKSAGRAVQTAESLRSLGFGRRGAPSIQDASAELSGMTGVRSADEMAAFAANLAKQKGFNQRNAMQAMGLYSSGLFGEQEILQRPRGLNKLEAQLDQRFRDMPFEQRQEMDARFLINQAAAAEEAARAPTGRERRMVRAGQSLTRATESPVWGVARNIADTVTLGAFSNRQEALGTIGVEQKLTELIKAVREGNKPKPQTNPTPSQDGSTQSP